MARSATDSPAKDIAYMFEQQFHSLTDRSPLSWQARLFHEHFAKNDPPSVIDIPTGLGKTMVMAIWLIARTINNQLPRRLIYVVDRRTVVDQATFEAKKLEKNWDAGLFRCQAPAISTLRGQLADKREWTNDPSRLAIVIGTVDLVGSALLFSGYRSSYKRRPLEAGFLGQDSLLVLDEAHLSRPFEKLICEISREGAFQKDMHGTSQASPMRVIRMSATSGSADSRSFTLQFDENGLLTDDDARDPTITDRFGAKKRLTITSLGEKEDLNKALADAAIKQAQKPELTGKRIAVFVRSPGNAAAIAEKIRSYATPSKSKPYSSSVEILTGTMRGLERDELVEKDVFEQRWLNGELMPDAPADQDPVFLICTSAGEVGFDLNADHLIGDAAPLDSWIQRLGRVNRRGKGIAIVQVFVKEPTGKQGKENNLNKHTIESASVKAIEALRELPHAESLAEDDRPGPILDASPRALRNLLKPEKALSPSPIMVELSDILLDAWSMTSIAQPMPGRPEVGPWLRGIDDELPQTTIAWRAELDESGFANLDLDDIQDWFDTHRILTHETLSVPTSDAAARLVERWYALDASMRKEVAAMPCVVDRAGLRTLKMEDLIKELSRKPKADTDSIRNADLILPASFGGICRREGVLDAYCPKYPARADFKTDQAFQSAYDEARVEPDVADERPLNNVKRRRETVQIGEEPTEPKPLTGAPINESTRRTHTKFAVEWPVGNDAWKRLFSYVPRREKLDWGMKAQTLGEHVNAVRDALTSLMARLELPAEARLAAELAADFHDHGKNRERWQHTIGGTATVGTTVWTQQVQREGDRKHLCLGKSGGAMKRDPRGYRHEFGSLREFADAFEAGKLLDANNNPVSQAVFDLAMHLIAVHHGRGRPYFPKGGFDPDCEARSDEIHTEAIRRFARLQHQYGWWQLAWLENLLRCADAMASASVNDDENQDEREAGE